MLKEFQKFLSLEFIQKLKNSISLFFSNDAMNSVYKMRSTKFFIVFVTFIKHSHQNSKEKKEKDNKFFANTFVA